MIYLITTFTCLLLADLTLYEKFALRYWTRWQFVSYSIGVGFYIAYQLYKDKE